MNALAWMGMSVPANVQDYVVRWTAVEQIISPVRETVMRRYAIRFSLNQG